MQSTKLSYARYMFYRARGIRINKVSYKRLFMSQENFETQYGITKAALLKMYPYPEETAQKNISQQKGDNSKEQKSGDVKSVQALNTETEKQQKDVDKKDEITRYLQSLLRELDEKDNK